jgi:hypothetical protein
MKKEIYNLLSSKVFNEKLINFIGKTNDKELTLKGINLFIKLLIKLNDNKPEIFSWYIKEKIINIIILWNISQIVEEETYQTKLLRDTIIKGINIELRIDKLNHFKEATKKRTLNKHEIKEYKKLLNSKDKQIYVRLVF